MILSDRMNRKTNIDLSISQEFTGSNPAGSAWTYSPGSQPVELEVEQAEGGARINVPDLDLWAIVKIGPGTTGSKKDRLPFRLGLRTLTWTSLALFLKN